MLSVQNREKTWQAGLLEAKIICSNGFSLSIETEWYKNLDNIDEKQDCEQKAFARLAGKLKKDYPRLPVILVAGSLYPNDTFFTICENNQWRFILSFKGGCLKTVWEEAMSLYPLEEGRNKQSRTAPAVPKIWETIMFINEIGYKKHILHWCEYIRSKVKAEKEECFVHISDIAINQSNVREISFYGRLRWKIENEGFNIRKNGGYNLQHKYSEKDFNAMQNYYQLLQIGHLLNQLTEKLRKVGTKLKHTARTLKSVWEDATASMLKECFLFEELEQTFTGLKQLRY